MSVPVCFTVCALAGLSTRQASNRPSSGHTTNHSSSPNHSLAAWAPVCPRHRHGARRPSTTCRRPKALHPHPCPPSDQPSPILLPPYPYPVCRKSPLLPLPQPPRRRSVCHRRLLGQADSLDPSATSIHHLRSSASTARERRNFVGAYYHTGACPSPIMLTGLWSVRAS